MILETIHLPELLPPADYARYCLLTTQSKDREYSLISSDSLVYTAFDYYNKGNDLNKKSLLFYYLGRSAVENNQQEKALEYYLKAQEHAHAINNRKLLGRITSQMGHLYLNQMLYDKALEMFYNSLQYLQSENDIRGEVFTLRDLGCVHLLNGDMDKAYHAFDFAIKKVYETQDSVLFASVLNDIGVFYFYNGDIKSAKTHLYKSLKLLKNKNAQIFLSLGDIYFSESKMDSAVFYFSKSIDIATENTILTQAYLKLSEIEQSKGHWKSAVEYLNLFITSNYSVINQTIEKNISAAEKKYQFEHIKNLYLLTKIKFEKKEAVFQILLISLLAVIITFLVWTFFHEKKKNRLITCQHQQLLKKNEEEKRLKQLVLQKTDAYRILISGKNDLLPKISNELWDKILSDFDRTFNHITSRLKSQFNKLSDHQIIMACLIKIGFDTFEIMRCMNISESNARIMKFRLKNTLKISGKHRELEDFLLNF